MGVAFWAARAGCNRNWGPWEPLFGPPGRGATEFRRFWARRARKKRPKVSFCTFSLEFYAFRSVCGQIPASRALGAAFRNSRASWTGSRASRGPKRPESGKSGRKNVLPGPPQRPKKACDRNRPGNRCISGLPGSPRSCGHRKARGRSWLRSRSQIRADFGVTDPKKPKNFKKKCLSQKNRFLRIFR